MIDGYMLYSFVRQPDEPVVFRVDGNHETDLGSKIKVGGSRFKVKGTWELEL
jgi:hypothetical protein